MPDRTRRLQPGEPWPPGAPKRRLTSDGYVVLSWKVGVREYVEVLEHRAVMNVPDGHVHHRNGRRTDNRPKNLEAIDPTIHGHLHMPLSFDIDEAARLYDQGYGTPAIGRFLGVDASNIYRALHRRGVLMRPVGIATENQRAQLSRSLTAAWASGRRSR